MQHPQPVRTIAPEPRKSKSALQWWTGWGPLSVLPCAVLLAFPAAWPRWAFMWALAFAIYCGTKWLTWRRTLVTAPLWKHLGYLLAWPGLDAAAFLNPPRPGSVPRPDAREWLFASAKTALGAAILFAGARLVPPAHPYWRGWVGMIGIVMSLHFGVFHILSCGWRALGVAARPLMNWPLASTSVSEFWGRRWNTAFRDLTHRFLFRPLLPQLGPRGAVLFGFVMSGVIHDVVISVPAAGGYGGPTLFFCWQGAALMAERSAWGKQAGLGRGWRGWLFTAIGLLAPVCFLFHPPFVERIIVPFLHALGAT